MTESEALKWCEHHLAVIEFHNQLYGGTSRTTGLIKWLPGCSITIESNTIQVVTRPTFLEAVKAAQEVFDLK